MVSKELLSTKQKYFEYSDKPQGFLAQQLRKQKKDCTKHKIKSDKGEVLMKPEDINGPFNQFFKNL